MLGYSPHVISLKEIFCFVTVPIETLEYIKPYRRKKLLTTLGSYYRYRSKASWTEFKHIKEIDSAIERFKGEIDNNFGIKFVSEAAFLVLQSLNIYERNFLTHVFGLNLSDELKVIPGVDIRIINAKNSVLEKLRKPVFIYTLKRVIEENKIRIFEAFAGREESFKCEDLECNLLKLNGDHRLAIEICYTYYPKFLREHYYNDGDYWFIKDRRKLARVIGAISRRTPHQIDHDF